MLRNVIFLATLLVIQTIDGKTQTTIRTNSTSGAVTERYYVDPYDHIEGTPYMDTIYAKGNIYMQREVFSNVELRYNIFREQMEYKQNKVLHVLNPDLLIKKIEVADRTFVVDVYQLKDKPKFGFFVRLDSGRITLMSKMIVGMTEFEGARALQDPKPAQYIRQPDTYYYKIDDGPLIKIGNIRKLIESLPDHKKEMEEFSKIEKISAKKPEGLTKFIQHYNSLK